MYQGFYNLGIRLYTTGVKAASMFNPKARDWVEGRQEIFQKLRDSLEPKNNIIWFHAASLGEAEMGAPVMQAVRVKYPDHKILLTFFSPSGMNHFKNNDLADYVFYLPSDTPENAVKFLDIVKPQLAFFIKYEIWANYFRELQKRGIPHIIAPAIFRADQFYFKNPHRNFFLPILKKIPAILVQDQNSREVLFSQGIEKVKVVGDSRFDRVLENTSTPFHSRALEDFSRGRFTLVGGSTWKPDEEILKVILNLNIHIRMIIAPHDISESNIERITGLFGRENCFLYNDPPEDPENYRVAVINNIGLLSKIYRYGKAAYIGGAFGRGIHNSLEAAAYGLPLFFGTNHQNFIEPSEMMRLGFAHEVLNGSMMQEALEELLSSQSELQRQSEMAREYVEEKSGVTDRIMTTLEELLS